MKKYNTSLFTKVSPNYPYEIDDEFVNNYWQNRNEIEISEPLSSEECEDFATYLKENKIQKIKYGENVDFNTIQNVNTMIKNLNGDSSKNVVQELNRALTSEEVLKIEDSNLIDSDKFLSKDDLTNISSSVSEYTKYEEFKKQMLTRIKELDLTELEASAYIYGYIRDGYDINSDNSKSVYSTLLSGEGNNASINILLCELLKNVGLDASVSNTNGAYTVNLNIQDDKYSVKGSYNLDILTDMNIRSAIDADNLYTKFMIGMDKNIIEQVAASLNKKMRLLENEIDSNKERVTSSGTKTTVINEGNKSIPVYMDNTMTFAIPLDEIKQAKEEASEKKEIVRGAAKCSEFLRNEIITDEDGLGEYLVRNGASQKIVNQVINNNSSNYYGILRSKEEMDIQIKKQGNKTSLYVPTNEKDNHSTEIITNENGSLTIINKEYSNFMDNGIRYGSASILDFKEDGDKVLIDEKLSKVSECQNITPEMILPVYEIHAQRNKLLYNNGNVEVQSKDSESVVCTIDKGMLIASNVNEQNRMQKVRDLGFDEKHYTKKKIAGLNKYSDGREFYAVEEEIDEELDESGLVNQDQMVLVKTSGKVSILLVSTIVGFVIGLGIGLALLILNIH